MNNENFPRCTSCGRFHEAMSRESAKHIASVEHGDQITSWRGLARGTIVMDKDGDLWHIIEEPQDTDFFVFLHPADYDYDCREFATQTAKAHVLRSSEVDEAYGPYYVLCTPVPVPSFTSVEEADAWMEANA